MFCLGTIPKLIFYFFKNTMSLYSSPSKYVREALEARRERQRAEIRERERTRQPRPFFGNRRNLHDHRNEVGGPQQTEATTETDNHSVHFMSKWKFMLPTIFIPKDLEPDDDHVISARVSEAEQSASEIISEALSNIAVSPTKSNIEDKNAELAEGEEIKSQLDIYEIENDDTISRRHRDIPGEYEMPFGLPESIPSQPIESLNETNCLGQFRKNRYQVSSKLTHSYARQSLFLKRVMIFLTTEYAFMIFWTSLCMGLPDLKEVLVENFNLAYIPLGVFVITKVPLRSMVKIRKLPNSALLGIGFIRLACLLYYCGAVSVFAQTDIILLTSILVMMSNLFFSISPHFVDYEVTSTEIFGMSLVVNIMFSILIIIPYTICAYEYITFFSIFIGNWLPSFIVSQCIMMFLIFEIKQIMSGWRFPLAEADWIFTVLYI